jgi:mycothiol synthase
MLHIRPAALDDSVALAELLTRCAAADGYGALSEFKALRVPVANGIRSIVGEAAGALIAVAVAAWHPEDIGEAGGYWAAEIALEPGHRSVPAYSRLLTAMEAHLGRAPALWAFAEDQVAAARHHGMTAARTLVEMRRPLPAPAGSFPPELSIRGFVSGRDEKAWLALNHEIFAHHPEAGSIDSADLALRMAQPWFDPNGLLILVDDDLPVGYCWTKMHLSEVGEIYMVGLKAAYRGKGLARRLTLAGLDHLARHGAITGMLYAETSNAAAIGLYESMGFAVARQITLYEPDGIRPEGPGETA